MTLTHQIITIAMCVLGTVITRFLPFVVFSEKRETPEYIKYLGMVLPAAVFGMLVVYCLKSVDVTSVSSWVPELISIVVTACLHIWKRQMVLSMAGGTLCYMVLIQVVFA